MTFFPSIFMKEKLEPKLMMANFEPTGRLRMKSISASLAVSIPLPLIEPLLSKIKIKTKSLPVERSETPGSSSSRTSNSSYG